MNKTSATPQISDAEWTVMKVLWEKSPRASRDVVDALAGSVKWKPKTIHTLLARLVKKGALKARKEGRGYQFAPKVNAEACQRSECRSFLDRVFDGEMAPFLACFVRGNSLTRAEIEELKRILNRKV